jgi:hypothetical protein
MPREMSKILGDCRDLAIHRLLIAFTSLLDRIGDTLMDRASKTDVRDEQQMFLDARGVLKQDRATLMSEFERRLRRRIDDRIAGREEAKQDFSKVDTSKLTLVDTTAMDEAVLTGNITRVVENMCHDELTALNRGVGHLMGQPDLETDGNPLAPGTIVDAFADSVKSLQTEYRIKFQILKEVNQGSLTEINSIYADLNRHLLNLRVMPTGARPISRAASAERVRAKPEAAAAQSAAEVDVMTLFRRMFGGQPMPQVQIPHGLGMPAGAMAPPGGADFPSIDMSAMASSRYVPSGPLPPTPSGYVPGMPIIQTPMLGEGLARLQAGETGFDLGGGAVIQFSGIPQGTQNVLRELQESPLGQKANQLESMTIELVAMLFDFVFETRDLPDGIKALLARLQIPVLKAAMLDGAFFAKKSHPARLLVNAMAQAGLGWSPVMGQTDPLYRKIDEIVHSVLDDFSDNLSLFDDLRENLEQFLAEEERAAESTIQSSAEEINQRDRRQIASVVAKSEIERRVESYPIPKFLAAFMRTQWQAALEHLYLTQGEESESWGQATATLEDLVWSVQPKKTSEDRKHLVALLPSLLKRMSAAVHSIEWPTDERERFMSNLVEAHAAAVKPSLSAVPLPTAAVAEQAKAEAVVAKAAGDEVAAAKAEALADAMAQAEPAPPPPEPEIIEDHFLEIAQSLDRGTWIEFENEDGQLAFAKLAWVSPLRGTYLFTNRQGQKALSMTADELAQRFRDDKARLVEAEPLLDRALASVVAQMGEKYGEVAA